MALISIPSLEYHLAHSCNLSCEQCSHYSNFHLRGRMPSPSVAYRDYIAWNDRIHPGTLALLGGEPLLNPNLIEHLLLARNCWPKSKLMLVTNGLHLRRHPALPDALVEVDCRLELSQHGTHEHYLKQFREAEQVASDWKRRFHGINIKIRKSHRGWMRQYQIVNGKPMPFDSKPNDAFKVCMQKSCMQLYQQRLWKCPALAYWPLLEFRLQLESFGEWELFRQYSPCASDCSTDALEGFVNSKAIPQCSLCPSKREKLFHSDPTRDRLTK
ncbi:radical SAM protein [Bremerella cremea]|uniref:Radical SAM protein n=1 Tax=Bremerella cremea TaxID=1031537 RepID=A0A368KTP6_9BACT|nr:radical SAM protein [Bremerella cremea]RCS49480.1 radical SAM protein [Bremerella cremea]